MDLEQLLRASLVAPDPGAVFTARVMARVGRGRGRRRTGIILIGTVLAVSAAAAALVWRMTAVAPHSIDSVAVPAVPEPGPVAPVPLVQPAPEVKEPVAAAPKAVTPEDNAPRYAVLVMPLRQEDQDLGKRRPVEALYAAMLDELRKVPGLTLQVPGESVPGAGGRADYVLTLTSLATTVSPAGGVMVVATDGTSRCARNGSSGMPCGSNSPQEPSLPIGGMSNTSYSYSANGSVVINTFTGAGSAGRDEVVWVELKVESPGPSTARFTWPVASAGRSEQRLCIGANSTPSECPSPAKMAAQYIQTLRLQVFPPDSAFQQRVLQQLGNPGQDPTGGMRFGEVMTGLARGDGSRLDAGTIRALVKYLATQPADTRASAWNTLGHVANPALVGPLVDSLRHDPDKVVRLAALASLLANYSADPEVRRAFEEIDREDADPMLRATVRRALYGPAQWRDDLIAALNNAELSYEDRLSPLIVNISSGTVQQDFEMSRVRQTVLREPQVLGPLIALVQEHLHEAGFGRTTNMALNRLAEVDDPAVYDLFLQLAQDQSLPPLVAMGVQSWARNHQNDPRVREILPQMEPMVPSGLLERMREVGGKPGEGAATFGSGAISTVVPAAQ